MTNKSIKNIFKYYKKFFSDLFSEKKSLNYTQACIDAAQCKGYLETVSNKADSFHRELKQLYEEDIKNSYLSLLNILSPYFRKGKVRLGIDYHEIGYYGKNDSMFIIGTNYGNKSFVKSFEYISISLLTGKKDERLHLFALPCYLGSDKVKLIEELLNFVKPFFNKIEVIQFDRGFYKKELIYWLEENNYPYLIHTPKPSKGEINDLVKTTKSFYKGNYKRKFYMNQTTYWMKTTLYISKNVRKHDWIFVSNLNFKRKEDPILLYKNRWQIETNYSVSNQNRIMSKSNNYIVRYFYFLCDILIQILWRLELSVITFKQCLRMLVLGEKKVIHWLPNIFSKKKKAPKWPDFLL